MSGLVFIDDENNNVLDEWMNDTSSFVKGASEVDLGEPVAGTSKGGLGFVETKASAKDAAAANKKKIANKAANKKRSLTGDDEDEMHGIVEHIEESRTSFKGKVEKKMDAVNKKKEEVQSKQNKKAKTNANANTSGAANTTTSAAHTNQETPNKQLNNKLNNLTSESTTAVVNVHEESKEDRENSRKRKRTKTRSKQKNIRRDNRAAEHKPAHLQVGSKEYQGRQLTKETKSVLGLAKK
eukprot:Colp12_sorted_trinity150504_noHs@10147